MINWSVSHVPPTCSSKSVRSLISPPAFSSVTAISLAVRPSSLLTHKFISSDTKTWPPSTIQSARGVALSSGLEDGGWFTLELRKGARKRDTVSKRRGVARNARFSTKILWLGISTNRAEINECRAASRLRYTTNIKRIVIPDVAISTCHFCNLRNKILPYLSFIFLF